MKLLLLCILSLNFFPLFAQQFSQEYGKVPLGELTLQKYDKDTAAEAVILYDMGKSYFTHDDNGFSVIFERKTKVKILKSAGIENAQVNIPYYFEGNIFEKVYDVEATSYNIENGLIKRVVLDNKTIYDEKKNDYWRFKKFAIPNVRPGTVIEYKYSIQSPYLFNLRDWDFQSKIPCVYSEYTTLMIPFYEYIYIMKGKDKFDVFENKTDNGIENNFGTIKYNDVIYKFGMKDVPAFRDESFMASIDDNLIGMDFQLANIHHPNGANIEVMSTWPKVCNDMLKESSVGKFLTQAEKSAPEVMNMAEINTKTPLERMEYIVNLVKNNFSWNGYFSKYASNSLKEFLKDKKGNSANINLYLTGLLRAAGLKADPVLISTRDNGMVYPSYPFLSFLNSFVVLVNIDGKNYLTDATEPLCPFDMIPPVCINSGGLILKKDGQDWVKLATSNISRVDEAIKIHFSPELDSLNFTLSASYSNYEAMEIKDSYKDDNKAIHEYLLQKGYANVDSLETSNFKDSNKNYLIKYHAKAAAEMMGDKIYISPFLIEPPATNPLKQASRTYKIDFNFPFGRGFSATIDIPSGYKADFIPQPYSLNNNLMTIDYKIVSSAEDKIIITGYYAFKNAVYEPTDYKVLKMFYNDIIKKFNEKVVLVKK